MSKMAHAAITKKQFLDDLQGRTFKDVVENKDQPFGAVLDFLAPQIGNPGWRNRRFTTTDLLWQELFENLRRSRR
jgi:hypothetical protein